MFRSSSAAVCMAFVRSARNLLGFLGEGDGAWAGADSVAVVPHSEVAPVVPQPESACSTGVCAPLSGAASVVGQPAAASDAPLPT